MMVKSHHDSRSALTLTSALTPILVFAPIVAIVCWTAAWIFREQFVLSATLLGLGSFPIVVAVVAYLLVLLKKLKIDR
jgi:hypothetical protein